MPDFTWIAEQDEFSSVGLTVRAQAISPLDLPERLYFPRFFPRRDVRSTKLRELTTIDFRPVSDRREWNQRGRLIPLRTPPLRELEMVPVESYFKIAEEEIQAIMERTLTGGELAFQREVGVAIPDRTDGLAVANIKRLEFDAMRAWATGEIVAKDPQTGRTLTVSYGMPAARYDTAATAWNDPTVNAYNEFIAFMEAALDLTGSVAGAVMRLATFLEIQADAPQPEAIPLTRTQTIDRIQQEMGQAFEILIVEESHDVFDDGGLSTTRTKLWPVGIVAAIPGQVRIGDMAFAPVSRAVDLSRQAPGAGIDVRGQTVYHEIENGGRGITVECQVNAFPVLNEQAVAVINAGV